MSTTLTIAKREFRANFDSPLAYVVICLGLLLLGGVFFFGGFWQRDRASLTELFALAPRGLSFLVVPVVTMRLVAEERRSGTLEMLITLPVKDHEVILGKFIGAWSLVLTLIAATALYPIMMFWQPWNLGPLDKGAVLAGYIGLLLYSAAAVAVGLLISALTESQVIAFFITFVVLFALHATAFFSIEAIPNAVVRDVVSFVSFDARLAPFTRGLVSTRDILYFASVATLGLLASFSALERRKWA